MKVRAFLIMVLTCICVSCSSDSDDAYRAPSKNVDEIISTVLNYQLQSQYKYRRNYVFISVDSEDPSEALLPELDDSSFVVQGVSKSSSVTNEQYPAGNLVDSETGNDAMRFYMNSEVSWLDETTITLTGGSYAHGLAAEFGHYVLEWSGKEWVVIEFVVEVYA